MKNRVRSKEIVVDPEELRRLCESNKPVVFRAEVRHSRIDLVIHAEQNEKTGQGKAEQ
jgi:hypothetical protein